MVDKNNFILYKDFKSTIDILTDEQAGKLIKAVFSYVNGRIEPDFNDGMLIVAFNILKTQLERDLQKYKTIVKRNQENGAKGGRPKNNPEETTKPKKPSGINKTQNNPSKPKKADSDSVSDSDNDSDKIYIKPLSKWEELFDKFWLEYPKKVNKGNAKKWFKSHKPDELLVNSMIEKVLEYIEKDVWNKENYQYIPHASSWLNAEGWTNEVIKYDKTNKSYKSEQEKQKDELLKFMTQQKNKEVDV